MLYSFLANLSDVSSLLRNNRCSAARSNSRQERILQRIACVFRRWMPSFSRTWILSFVNVRAHAFLTYVTQGTSIRSGRPCTLAHNQCTLYPTLYCRLYRFLSGTLGIIVRNEAARQKLRADIGPVGIILYVEPFFPCLARLQRHFQHTSRKQRSWVRWREFYALRETQKPVLAYPLHSSFTRIGYFVQLLWGVLERKSLAAFNKFTPSYAQRLEKCPPDLWGRLNSRFLRSRWMNSLIDSLNACMSL